MSGRTFPKVAMVMGGPSAEREVSLSSGKECADALRGEGFDVIEIDAGPDLCQQLRGSGAEVAFNALHGRWGEDGCVQGIFEWIGLPYTHSGVLASSLAMDKQRCKASFAAAGLPVSESLICLKAKAQSEHAMKPPYVVKPNNEGSSVGIYIVPAGANAPPQLAENMPDEVMVEAYVPGRELTVTVQGDRALTVTDILTDGWYDYHAKYAPGGSRHVVPAELPKDIFDACMAHSETAHSVLGCRGISRTDFRWDEARGLDGLIVLETNTQPGMTPTSLSPEQATHCGMSFGALCRWIVEDASCNR